MFHSQYFGFQFPKVKKREQKRKGEGGRTGNLYNNDFNTQAKPTLEQVSQATCFETAASPTLTQLRFISVVVGNPRLILPSQ